MKPIFTGIRKGYSAFWVSDDCEMDVCFEKIRKLDSRGKWKWGYAKYRYWKRMRPCWLTGAASMYLLSPEAQVKLMKKYDKRRGNKTIFLGYVKEQK